MKGGSNKREDIKVQSLKRMARLKTNCERNDSKSEGEKDNEIKAKNYERGREVKDERERHREGKEENIVNHIRMNYKKWEHEMRGESRR